MRRQDGSCGWSKAHDKDLMAGWAGEVIGEMDVNRFGSVSALGKRMGDTKGGQRCREISARLSTMSKVPGHCAVLG